MLTVLYLIVNEGYAATSGSLLPTGLCVEAIRLTRELTALMLNRAVAVAEVRGSALALATPEGVELSDYH